MTQPSISDAPDANLSPGRLSFYLVLLLGAALAGYVYTLRTQGIFACPASGYANGQYLAYCQAAQYGDYDHGAFWFSLEPGIRDCVAHTEVLLLGNSRVQFGFTTGITEAFMQALPARYFLLGFAYWENYTFERALLRQIEPRPSVVIINVDDYFETHETDVARAVMRDDALRGHYRIKRLWQWPHHWLCSPFPALCGGNEAFYRSLETGGYHRFAAKWGHYEVSYDPAVDGKVLAAYVPRAKQFLDSLPVPRSCVLMTIVPSSKTHLGTARALAASLGVQFIAPTPRDLTTFDSSHLNPDSARRWSRAFFADAGTPIRRCLADRHSTEP